MPMQTHNFVLITIDCSFSHSSALPTESTPGTLPTGSTPGTGLPGWEFPTCGCSPTSLGNANAPH